MWYNTTSGGGVNGRQQLQLQSHTDREDRWIMALSPAPIFLIYSYIYVLIDFIDLSEVSRRSSRKIYRLHLGQN